MNPTHLKRSLSGLALLVGLITGSALAMVPSSIGGTEASGSGGNQVPRPMICSISCKDCRIAGCGVGEGTCGYNHCASR